MTTDIHQLIAAINPDIYCDAASRREVQRIVKAVEGDPAEVYARAVSVVQSKERNTGEGERLSEANPFDLEGQRHPCERHQLVFDSLSEAPERIYFTLVSILGRAGWKLEKMSDGLVASTGSAMSQPLEESLVRSQEHAARLFRLAHETLRRLLRDLEEVGDLEDDGVPRNGLVTESTLPPTVVEMRTGLQRMRRSLLLSGIRSELEALRTYARWLRPFLRIGGANRLEATASPDLISAFNTTLFRVEILAINGDLLAAELLDGTLPSWLATDRVQRPLPVLVVEAMFRTVSAQERGSGFHHRGLIDITLTSYALREDELRVLQAERDREDLRRIVGVLGVMDERMLTRLEEELNSLIMPVDEASQPSEENTNPFSVLWAVIRSLVLGGERVKREHPAVLRALLRRDSVPEQVLRSRALVLAREACAEVFSVLKTQLGLATPFPEPASPGGLRHAAVEPRRRALQR